MIDFTAKACLGMIAVTLISYITLQHFYIKGQFTQKLP